MTVTGRSSGHPEFISSVVILTLLHINSEVIIPAPYPVVGSNRQVRGKLQQESSSETMDSGSSPE
jgi:hypothetical protein